MKTGELRWYLISTGFMFVLLTALGIGLAAEADDSRSGEDLEKKLERLRALPYTSFTEEQVNPDSSGVILWDRDRACPGYNLYCSATRPQALLFDMGGELVHRWDFYPEKEHALEHAVMLPNGDLIAMNRQTGVARLTWDSEIVWHSPLPVHHDIQPLPDGTFLVLLESVKTYRELNVVFDEIARLGQDGQVVQTWSTYDHLDEIKQKFDWRSSLDTILDSLMAAGSSPEISPGIRGVMEVRKINPSHRVYNYFHLNTISTLPETDLGLKDDRFAQGNLLICARNVNQIAILDSAMEVTWAWGEGVLEWPHHPIMLESGNITVFDNGTRRGYSRVIEVNPATGQIEWEYVASPPQNFFTSQKGSAQRLPNGNTLISEGNRGRAFEVTGGGEIVWEWFNPLIKKGRRAQVYRIMRLPCEYVDPLLEQPK